MRFIPQILIAVLLSGTSLAQDYSRWWQYEDRLRKLSPEQLQLTTTLAQDGDLDSQMLLAAGYRKGVVLPKDPAQFVVWVKRGAEQGNPEAEYTLADIYRHGTNALQQDFVESAKWQRRAAEHGQIVAQHNLGVALLSGRGEPKDPKQGETWLLKSAEGGFTQADLVLGVFYLRGEGGEANPQLAELHFRKAAERGHPSALAWLAHLYSTEEGAPRDPDFVETVLLRAAEMGQGPTQYQLAKLYRKGYLGRPDVAKALEWYQISAKHDYAPSAFDLGQMLESTETGTADINVAAQWYLQAAQQGYSPAVFKIGDLYRKGRGVPLDIAAAYRWFTIGARLGAADSQQAQLETQKQLSETDRQNATAEAERWIAAHPFEMAQVPGKFRSRWGVWVPDDPPPPTRGPSTEEERAKAIELAHFLESTPLGEDAKKAATWLADWMRDVPDFFFQSCDLFQDRKNEDSKGEQLRSSDYRYHNVLYWQLKFSGAAFQVQHPQAVKDQLAVYQAGVLGALKSYEAILQIHPEAHWPLLDAWQHKRTEGTLPEFVHARVNEICR